VAGGRQGGDQRSVANPKFLVLEKLSEKLFVVEKLLSKNAKFMDKSVRLKENLRAKLKF